MENEIKKFSEQFFQKLGCSLSWSGDFLKVDNVPKSFENFVGKHGPFVFGFNGAVGEGVEVLKKGGYFLNAMANFLKTKSKVTLVKLDVPLDVEQEILTRFSFPNAKIVSIKKPFVYESVTRFLFGTKFQFLNEREHERISVFVKDGEIFEIDPLEIYDSCEGNSKDIRVSDFSGDYESAKEVVKEKVKGKIERIGKSLNVKLEKELARVRKHSEAQIKELEDSYNSLVKQISKLEKELEKKSDEKILKRLEKLRGELRVFDLEGKRESLEKEKNILEREENAKHKLAVGHQLINTSVVYYPVFDFIVELDNGNAKGNVSIHYDPVQKYMPPLICPATKELIYKIYLDDAGVACSGESLVECFESGKNYCSSSVNLVCEHSGKKIHSSNAGKCFESGKIYGKSYLKKEMFSGKDVYVNFLKTCSGCGGRTFERNLSRCPRCGVEVCSNCLKKGFDGNGVITICKVCDGRKV